MLAFRALQKSHQGFINGEVFCSNLRKKQGPESFVLTGEKFGSWKVTEKGVRMEVLMDLELLSTRSAGTLGFELQPARAKSMTCYNLS